MQGEASKAQLERARRRGDAPLSQRLVAAVTLAAACVLLPWCVAEMWQRSKGTLATAIATTGGEESSTLLEQVTEPLVTLLLPVMAGLALAALLAVVAQGGGRFAKKRAPAQKSEAPLGALVGMLSFVVVVAAGAVLVYGATRGLAESSAISSVSNADPTELGAARRVATQGLEAKLTALSSEASSLLVLAAAFALLVGVLDAWLVRFAWRRRIAASHEHERRGSEDEVAPEVRRERQRAHRALGATARQAKGAVTVD